ncbi:MAG TPA: COX15/CtaA family protein [Longimicrobiales bacterium]|nr:COX15/CtaA family protein [Longimicrobiales bacterium]
MSKPYRAFVLSVFWTLGLLLLGSVVHATESSLACPDWPTCFGTMFPEMTGGVFWEHLHRLVAGGLILIFALATWITWRRTEPGSWLRTACVGGMALLLVQAVFGGLTVIYRLPDAISTSHLAMAFGFLSLATVLAVATSPRRLVRDAPSPDDAKVLRVQGTAAALLVFAQSVVGGVVRHTDAGMACPDLPTCLGEWVPPLSNGLVATHFLHRVLAVVATLAVLVLSVRLLRRGTPDHLRRFGLLAAVLVLAQSTLGIVAVLSILAVTPVSFHTLGAAALLATLTTLAAWGWLARPDTARHVTMESGALNPTGAPRDA